MLHVDDLQHSPPLPRRAILRTERHPEPPPPLHRGFLHGILVAPAHVVFDLVERVPHATDRAEGPERLLHAIHRDADHLERPARGGEQQRRVEVVVDRPRVGLQDRGEVAVHLLLAVEHAAVQQRVVAHAPRQVLRPLAQRGPRVARVDVCVVLHEVLDDRQVAEARGEADDRPAEVQGRVGVEELARGVLVHVRPIGDEEAHHVQVLLDHREV
mmetsp:Transcript_2616/g.6513  ORF Transcript_2616/g.6513 Transcript_2616/m.6513 type:complete len:214 (-) Transcript_2616:1050-1691(-)